MASSSSLSPSASPPPPPPAPSHSHSSSPSPSPNHVPRILPAPESKSKSKSTSSARKAPPIPWTHQETLALIQAYQEKWYSLKKGQLKAFQWEEVSVTVAARCGFDEPSKTATQCRHKIEKLRKRYRSELPKPYPNSWQYFELLDQMERGPTPLYARPITAVAKSFSHNTNSNSNSNCNNNISNFNHGYGSLYSNSANYYNNDSHGDGGGSDDSDENFNSGHGVKAAARNKSKSINNLVGGGVKGRVIRSNGVPMDRGFSGSGSRSVRVLRNQMNGVRKQYYDGDDSDDDNDNEEEDDDDEEEEEVRVEEEDGAGMELAAEIRGFTERFIGMESKKIEMMRETERYRMEMERKRMEMILEAQRKICDSIGRTFVARKKAKIDRET